jgi:hypothetical protein
LKLFLREATIAERESTINDIHLGEDDLESYSTSALSDESTAFVELHLLICEFCRERLVQAEEYVAAIKESGRELTRRSRRPVTAAEVPEADSRVRRAGG